MQHDNKIYVLTDPEALTFSEVAHQLSRAVGPIITFVDAPLEAMRATLADLSFPSWQANGLLEEFAMWRSGGVARRPESNQECVKL